MQINGWQLYRKQAKSVGYASYSNRLVVIVVHGIRGQQLHLPHKALSVLGRPKLIRLYTCGTAIGLNPVAQRTDPHAYRVKEWQLLDGKYCGNLYISKCLKERGVAEGVYPCRLKGGILFFDQASEPERIA